MNQQRLEWMQAAYAELSGGLAAMFGNNVIVSGCIVVGQTVSDGWIVVDGELLPFVGSQTGVLDTFLIREDKTPLTFKDGAQKNIQFRKYAHFGTSSDAIRWDSLTRLPSFFSLSDMIEKHLVNDSNPHKVTKSQVGLSNLPNAKSDSVSLNSTTTLATSKAVKTVNDSLNTFKDRFVLKRYTINLPIGTGMFDGKLDDMPIGYSIFVDDGSLASVDAITHVYNTNGEVLYKVEKRNSPSNGAYIIYVLYILRD